MPAARCAFECTLRQDPQRADGVQSEQSRVARHAGQLQAVPQAEQVPPYKLSWGAIGAGAACAACSTSGRAPDFLVCIGLRTRKAHKRNGNESIR